MLSSEQEEQKRIKMLIVAKYFLEHGGSIEEVAEMTGISSSSVQRYLNDEELVILLGKESYNTIQEKLSNNKKAGLSRGGQNYHARNQFMKDENGRFAGSKKR